MEVVEVCTKRKHCVAPTKENIQLCNVKVILFILKKKYIYYIA